MFVMQARVYVYVRVRTHTRTYTRARHMRVCRVDDVVCLH